MPKAKLKKNANIERMEELFRKMDEEDSVVIEAPKKKPKDSNASFREPKSRTHPRRLECGHWDWWLGGTKNNKNRICTDPRCDQQRKLEQQQEDENNE